MEEKHIVNRRRLSEPTVGRAVSSSEVRTEKIGVITISGLRPIASDSPPSTGEMTKSITPDSDSSVPAERHRTRRNV